MAHMAVAEYIWLDGAVPTKNMRSKAKVLPIEDLESVSVDSFPVWNFDGSSTYQSAGSSSDLILQPVNFIKDPIRGEGNFMVMCEVMNQDGTPHASNSRAALRAVYDAGGEEVEPWCGFEQEYTLFKNNRPYGFPEKGYPAPQGPYYCGVSTEDIYGRDLVEAHLRACLDAGVRIYGINAEVMPGQWEFQVGFRGLESEEVGALCMADHLWFARYLLMRLAEGFGLQPSFENKPVKGDWNGAGCHTNFSTKFMRAEGGIKAIHEAIEALGGTHDDHIEVYGDKLHERLTGEHETCHIGEFKAGVTDRGCSIRIPIAVEQKGYGYLEDRRPGANSDPYMVAAQLIKTVCGISDVEIKTGWDLAPV